MRRILLLTILILFFFNGSLIGQSYSNGIGIRGGFMYGLTAKHFIGYEKAVEGILSFGFRSIRITGLYEKHTNAFDVVNLSWYYGLGAHVAFYTFPGNEKWIWNGYKWKPVKGEKVNSAFGIGIDGILGLEYEIPDIPFTVSVDYKPSFEYNTLNYFPFLFWDAAISLRYIF